MNYSTKPQILPHIAMSFWNRLKLLFAKPAQANENQQKAKEEVLLHEVLQRSPAEQQQYAVWEQSTQKTEFLNWLSAHFAQHLQTKKKTDDNLTFLMIPSVNGFVLHYTPQRWDCDDMQHLFDFFKNRLKQLGYWPHVSDIRAVRRGKTVETTHRHYLKPPRNFAQAQGEPIQQLFGNVLLTLNFVNERLDNFKFCATSYNDRMYAPADDFAKLMRLVCHLE